ncbi:MAP7 domain-containing protein 1-like [Macrobrachium rosenbergii]|uniref:MAP7 domain-containing protein 1-like n=1 Tax=Macrobrachium rosenbergii TaxID=79674 RepID=UPI0034D4DA08
MARISKSHYVEDILELFQLKDFLFYATPALIIHLCDKAPKTISNPSPVSGPAPVPVPRHPINLHAGDSKIDSQSLPVPLECTEQCQPPVFPNGKQSPNPAPVPGPASVLVPEHTPDLHSRDPTLDPLSSSSLAPLPVLSSADTSVSKNSATPQLADELMQLQRLGAEPLKNAPAPAIKEADPGGTKLSSSDLTVAGYGGLYVHNRPSPSIPSQWNRRYAFFRDPGHQLQVRARYRREGVAPLKSHPNLKDTSSLPEYVQSTQIDALTHQNQATDNHRAFKELGKEADLTGLDLTKWVKEQLDDLAKQEKEERLEQRNYEAEQRNYEAEQRKYEGEQRQLENEREERRGQHELALKEKELELEKARKENAEVMAIEQASSPTPAAPNAPTSSINSIVPKWTEDKPEA